MLKDTHFILISMQPGKIFLLLVSYILRVDSDSVVENYSASKNIVNETVRIPLIYIIKKY